MFVFYKQGLKNLPEKKVVVNENVIPDGWETEDPTSYSEAKIYAATGGSNNSVHVTARIPQAINRSIDVMIQSGKTKYLTKTDFIRDALYHRLHWVELNQSAIKLELDDPLSVLRVVTSRAEKTMMREQMEQVIEQLIEANKINKKHGFTRKAKEEVLDAYRDVSRISDPEWRDYLKERLEETFDIDPADIMEL